MGVINIVFDPAVAATTYDLFLFHLLGNLELKQQVLFLVLFCVFFCFRCQNTTMLAHVCTKVGKCLPETEFSSV